MSIFRASLTLALLASLTTFSYASQQNLEEGTNRAPVQFLAPVKMVDHAKDPATLEILGKKEKQSFFSVSAFGTMLLGKTLRLDGNGAGLMVVDLDFEPDHAVNFLPMPGFEYDVIPKGIAHGATVASVAASKVPESGSLANGACIYNVRGMSQKEREKLREYREAAEKEVDVLKAEQAALVQRQQQIEDNQPAYQKEQADLLAAGKNYEAYIAMEENLRKSGKLVGEHMTLNRRIDALNKPFELASPILTMDTLDRIEQCLEFCHVQKQPLPRVLNFSLAFEAEKNEEQAITERLSQILRKNDILMVVAAGNDGKALGDLIVSNKVNKVDLRNCLDKYPELCQNLLVVGAFFNDDIADYSARAGHAKEHVLIAQGYIFDNATYNEDGSVARHERNVQGTSFAAPRVAAMAVLLGKYFPTLSMPEIKQIILKSAHKPDDYNPEDIGHGVLDPMQAWIAACQLETNKKPTFFEKLKSIFSMKI